jgi:molybdopterin-biosynthesis enzyme MoeA-like protein
MVDGLLDQTKFQNFVRRYMAQDNLVLYANSQTAIYGNIEQAFGFTRENMTENRIRIASEDFSAKIIIEPTGVAVGHLTSQSTQTLILPHYNNT